MGVSTLKTMFLIGLLSIFGSPAWSEDIAGPAEAAVAALESQWLDSMRANSPDAAAPFLADKFVITYADGTVYSKADSLAVEKTTKYLSAEESESKVIAFGDTAIAVGLIKAKGIDPTGKPFETAWRYTDTWVKMPGGKWQCVASHASTVAM